jgi:flagellar basal body P-ring formation protein FlgA
MTCRVSHPFGSAPLRRVAAALAALLAMLAFATLPAVAAPAPAAWAADVRQVITEAARVEAARRGAAVRQIDVVVGELDARLKLAPCARIEAHLPSGARAWGRSRAGLRCLEGPTRWSVSIPVTVRALGPGPVAARTLRAGDVVTESDLRTAEVDLAAETSPVVPTPAAAIGRTLARAVDTGQPVRAADLQSRRWFDAGDTVRVVARGAGFAVQGSAQALNAGVEGQVTRVRTENGRILSVIPVGEREVEVAL